MTCSAARIRRRGSPSSRSPTCSCSVSSGASGSGFIRCLRSSPPPSSRRMIPAPSSEIHRRAAGWLRRRGLYVEAIMHASAAGDHDVVAEILSTYHLAMIRNGRAGTLLRWARTLPDDCLAGASGAGRRRSDGRDHARSPDARATPADGARESTRRPSIPSGSGSTSTRCWRRCARPASIAGSARRWATGRRAVDLAERGADDVLVAALATLAHALYFAGELDEAWTAALRAVERPDAAAGRPDMPWPGRPSPSLPPIAAD